MNRSSWHWALVGAAAAGLALLVGSTGFVTTIEAKSYDWRVAHLTPPAGDSDVVLVLIDERSLQKISGEPYGMAWPFPRELYCPVIQYLTDSGARTILFDILFAEPQESDPAFEECLAASGRVILAYRCDDSGARDGVTKLPASWPGLGGSASGDICALDLPRPDLIRGSHWGGRIDMRPDADGVVRWVHPVRPTQGGGAPLLGVAPLIEPAAAHQITAGPAELVIGDLRVPLDEEGRMLIPYRTIDDPYPVVPFIRVLVAGERAMDGEGETYVDPTTFKDKVVFIATSAPGAFDLRVLPIGDVLPGVLTHANVYDSMARQVFLRRSAGWLDTLVTFLFAMAMAAALMVAPTRGSLGLRVVVGLLLVAGFVAANFLAFSQGRLWLGLIGPLTAMGIALTGGSVLNYLTEGRARQRIRFAFGHYLAPEVIDLLIRDPTKLSLGGERREITCFFSDIVGFTTIAEQMEPGALVALMNECLGEMTHILLEEGGTIDKYIGDAIVGIFGAPLDQPDHAARACAAALRCQARLDELRPEWIARGYPEVQVRIGLNSGTALVGNMGSARRFDYTMLGDMVNLGARLEAANKVYGTWVLMGEETRRLAGAAVVSRAVDRVQVKGKSQPTDVFEPLAMSAQADQNDLERSRLHGAAFVAYLERRWGDARDAIAELEALAPGDSAAAVLAERITLFEGQEPGVEWNGVFEMKTK